MISVQQYNIIMLVAEFYPLPMGGSETQALRLAEYFVQKGSAVTILTKKKVGLKKKEVYKGIEIFRVSSTFDLVTYLLKCKTRIKLFLFKKKKLSTLKSNIQKEYGTVKGYTDIIVAIIFFLNCLPLILKKRKKIDMIHVHTVELTALIGVALARIVKKKIVVKDSTMNGLSAIKLMPMGKCIQKMIIDNSYFVAISSDIENNFITLNIPQKNIFRISNGVRIPESISEYRINSYRCLFIGNLYQQPAKGIDILLQAWVKVSEKYRNATLDIVGDGDLDFYRKFSDNLKLSRSAVSFWGKRNDIQEFHRRANIFILPSRREGMSNALLEAMAASLPCIATNISGNQDLIKNKENGLLIPPEDKESLSSAIIWCFENYMEAATLGRRARNTIINNYNIDIIGNKYLQMYDDIMNQK